MLGSENLIEILKDELRIGKGETTADGMFTFEVGRVSRMLRSCTRDDGERKSVWKSGRRESSGDRQLFEKASVRSYHD